MMNRGFYNEILTEHNIRPEFKHDLEDANIVLEGVNPNCGDDIWLKLKVEDGIIKDGAFVGDGCAISQASADIMLGMIIGKTKEEALKLGDLFFKMIKGDVNISNNAISRLIQNTPKMSGYMPLLLVQIDKEFLNINLYEDNVLSFSRYFKIDPADYNNAEDYVNQAIYDNLFRMFQFFQSRKDMKPIKEMMFYGEIGDFIALTNTVSGFSVPCHILSAPTTIASRADFEFTVYANAIGALYKVNKELEHINLLDTTAAKESKGLNTFFIGLGAAALISVLAVVGANVVVDVINNSIKSEITKVQAQINDTALQARLTTLQQKEGVLANFQSYKDSIANAELMYNYMPKGTTAVYKMLREPFTEKQDGIESVTKEDIRKNLSGMKLIDSVDISGYSVTATYSCKNQAQPSQYVRALIDQGYFENITYTGYTVEKGEDNKETVEFSLTMLLKAGNGVAVDKNSANSIIEAGENGTQTDTSSTASATESTAESTAQ